MSNKIDLDQAQKRIESYWSDCYTTTQFAAAIDECRTLIAYARELEAELAEAREVCQEAVHMLRIVKACQDEFGVYDPNLLDDGGNIADRLAALLPTEEEACMHQSALTFADGKYTCNKCGDTVEPCDG